MVQLAQARHFPLIGQTAHVVQRLLADGQDLSLERVLILQLRIGDHDCLADHRHRLDDPLAEAGEVGGHFAPAEHGLAFGDDVVASSRRIAKSRASPSRQEAHRDRVPAGRRQLQVMFARPMAQQRIGHLDQAAGAVPHQRVRADRAPMVEVHQDLQPALNNIV